MATMSIFAGILVFCVCFDQTRNLPKAAVDGATARTALFLKFPFLSKYVAASSLLILACILSLISARFFPLEYNGRSVPVNWFKDLSKMVYFILPVIWALGWAELTYPQRRTVIATWLTTFGILSILGVLQVFTGWPRAQPNPNLPGFYHAILFLGHHLSVASIWIFPFFVVLDYWSLKYTGKHTGAKQQDILKIKSPLPHGLLSLFVFFGLATLFFTYSRTLWIGLPIGLGIWVIRKVPRKYVALLLGAVLILGLAASQAPILRERVTSAMGIQDRIELWKANIDFFRKRPLFGVGLGKNQELSGYYFQALHPDQKEFFIGHAHAIYLEVLSGLGIFGTAAWIIFISVLFSRLRELISKKPTQDIYLGIFCALIVFLINGLTQVNFWEGKVLHQLMWVIAFLFVPEQLSSYMDGNQDSYQQ